jgi:tetratricopeptide (TPR) repeat protein
MTYRPSSPDIHIWAGHLLFCIGAYQDAAKAYSNINNIQKNPKVLLERAKCYIAYKDVSSAVQDLKYILDIQPDPRIKFDYSTIEALRLCSDGA